MQVGINVNFSIIICRFQWRFAKENSRCDGVSKCPIELDAKIDRIQLQIHQKMSTFSKIHFSATICLVCFDLKRHIFVRTYDGRPDGRCNFAASLRQIRTMICDFGGRFEFFFLVWSTFINIARFARAEQNIKKSNAINKGIRVSVILSALI